ncbi:hypothetical protein NWFMUON74_58560 [Nocardia wallacei]|uniref:Uncharacterized protein n=1 Tax=Nocardia wallacei TaxID=480035 RepID=A0A7G1KY77_9NOCA|nr:hypothetical protein NWFMUON74_58560 [Nocardia wallacei]
MPQKVTLASEHNNHSQTTEGFGLYPTPPPNHLPTPGHPLHPRNPTATPPPALDARDVDIHKGILAPSRLSQVPSSRPWQRRRADIAHRFTLRPGAPSDEVVTYRYPR